MKAENIHAIFAAQQAHAIVCKSTEASERCRKLTALRDSIQRNFGEVIAALASDLRKPSFEAAMDAGAPLMDIAIAVERLAEWMAPQPVTLGPFAAVGARAYVKQEPKGQVLIFGPWNFPFGLIFQPLVAAIAAGNTCVLKPSELAPETSRITAKIISETFPPDEVTVIEGGPEVAVFLLELPFDHIFFTGSTAIGRQVMAAASRHLTSVTLELGGRCPVIVDSEVDLRQAARRIAWGKFLNAGQVCLSPNHVSVRPHDLALFAQYIAEYIRGAYYTDGQFNRQEMARIINQRLLTRLHGLLADALNRGAHLVCGGTSSDDWLEPTVLVNVPRDCALMQEEIFGPILPILAYDGPHDLAGALGPREKPLALYLFSNRADFVDEVLRVTSSGGVTINDVIVHAAEPNLPFGGVGTSGMGAYHGVHGFREMSHARSIYQQSNAVPGENLKFPPYGERLPG